MQCKLIAILSIFFAIIYLTEGIKIELIRDDYGNLGTNFDLYEREYQQGLSTHVSTDGPCKNLIKGWRKRASAIDTRGTCGRVCSELDCQGECAHVLPNVGEQMLRNVKMDKKIQSVSGCFEKAYL